MNPLDSTSAVKELRALRVFVASLVVLAFVAYVPIVRAGALGALGGLALPLIMWAPGVSAIIAAIAAFRSLVPCGLAIRPRALPWLIAGWVIPAVYTAIIYLPLGAAGIVQLGHRNFTFDFLVVGLGQSLLFATGEELGWRGLVSPLMTNRFGFLRGNLMLGVLWAIYHFPAILFAGYARSQHAVFGMVAFTVTVILLSLFLGALRALSGSVWPAALLHATHNNLFLHIFDPMKKTSPAASWLVGEQGILLTLVMGILAAIGLALYQQQQRRVLP